MSNMTDVMIDLETLSLRSNAVVLSVGMCWWHMGEEWNEVVISLQTQYSVLSLQDQIEKGRHIDESTVKWWMTQSQTAREAIASPDAWGMSTFETLEAIMNGARNIPVERVWSHGAAFDIPILFSLFDDYGYERPWDRKLVRDTRTLFGLYMLSSYADEDEISKRIKPDEETEHHAMGDAINQARAVHFAYNHITATAL